MDIVVSIILIVFPILMYLVFCCYNILVNKNMARIVFIITVCTSLYFCLRTNIGHSEMLIFCNIPIIICYLKKEGMLAVTLSIMAIIFGYFRYDMNTYIVICKHMCYLIAYIFTYKKKYFNSLYLKLSAIIQGFFVSFEYFMINDGGIDKIFSLILYILIIYLITFFCLYLFKLADNITLLYLNMNKVNDENKLKNSLFKLTHEIKNPIAVCKGYLDMMNLDNVEKSRKYINIIKSEIDRSLNVISDFMEYSKVKVNKEIFDMVMLMDELYDSFKILLGDKDIKFNYHNQYDDIYLWGDYERLKQVFVNIVKNSVEAITSHGIIDIDVSLSDKYVFIKIKDNGIGMTEEELERVSEMFWTTKKNGTGLGVALSNEIIMAHNGEIKYNSVKNEGTECIVSLPL